MVLRLADIKAAIKTRGSKSVCNRSHGF